MSEGEACISEEQYQRAVELLSMMEPGECRGKAERIRELIKLSKHPDALESIVKKYRGLKSEDPLGDDLFRAAMIREILAHEGM